MSPEMAQVIAELRARRAARSGGGRPDFAEIRKGFAIPGGPRSIPDDCSVDPVKMAGVDGYWLVPSGARNGVLLFVHGGGFTLGSLRSHGPLAECLGRSTGRRVLFPEYRLAPEQPFPAAYEDIIGTWHWLVDDFGADPESVLVAGDSAGGALLLGLMHALRDAGEPLPAGAVLISSVTDLTASGASVLERADEDPTFTSDMVRSLGPIYLAGASPRTPEASPLFASQAGLPPLLIEVGGGELLLSDSERLAEAATAAGTEVSLHVAEHLPHVYQGALDTPEAAESIARIAAFDRSLSARRQGAAKG